MNSLSPIVLRAGELAQINEIQDILLRPLDYPTLDDWRLAVNRRCRTLLGADMASFLVRIPGEVELFSEEVDPQLLRRFGEIVRPIDALTEIKRRSIGLGVCNRPMLWDRHYRALLRSEYFSELIRPAKAYDALSASVGDGSHVVGQLMMHHTSTTGRKFGERGVQLLRMLFPAFRAGVRTLTHVHADRSSLATALDQLGLGVLLMDHRLRHLHRSPLANRLMEDPRCSGPIAGLVAESVRRLADSKLEPVPDMPLDTVDTPEGRFRVSVTRAAFGLVGERGGFLVIIEPVRLSHDALRAEAAALGLTARQVDVAMMLTKRMSNREIAAALQISPHTAHHHTDVVLRKLRIRSRLDVADRLASTRWTHSDSRNTG